jgi:hypothetical protein
MGQLASPYRDRWSRSFLEKKMENLPFWWDAMWDYADKRGKCFLISEILRRGFDWNSSKEGYAFWYDIYKNLLDEVNIHTDSQGFAVFMPLSNEEKIYCILNGVLPDYMSKIFFTTKGSLIDKAFLWNKTIRGHYYWRDVYVVLENLLETYPMILSDSCEGPLFEE